MTEQDARTILNLEADYSAEQVREAYRDLVKVWHPDRFANDERLRDKAARRLQEINSAYALLQGEAAPRPSNGAINDDDPEAPSASASTPPSSPGLRDTPSTLTRLIATGVAMGVGIVALTTIVFWPQLRRTAPEPAATVSANQGVPGEEATNARGDGHAASSPRVQRPESGTELIAPQRQGGGSLVVYNQSTHDGVVALVTSAASERAVYVRAGEEATLANVATGRYLVRMALGLDWIGNRFTRDARYQELEQPVDFVEHAGDRDVEFTRLTLSLQPVVAGMQGVRETRPFLLRP